MQRVLRASLATTFASPGDEISRRGVRPTPPRRHYGDYPQIEDGVGMVRSFREEFARLLRRLKRHPPRKPEGLRGTVLTGTLFEPVLEEMIESLNGRWGTRLKVLAVENRYFGSEIVVAGLMTGSCVLAAREQIEGDFVVIPRTAHKSDEPVMLDGTTLESLGAQLGLPVRPLDLEGFAALLASS